jgi:thiol-disulfide isomerase/thioredoxin
MRSFASYSQAPVWKEFILQYTVYSQTTDELGVQQEVIGKQMLVVGNQILKVVSQTKKHVTSTVINDFRHRKAIGYHTNGKEYVCGFDAGFRSHVFNVVPPLQKVLASQILLDTKRINGFDCKKAVLIYGDQSRLAEVWYDSTVRLEPEGFTNDLLSIPGVPVVISFTTVSPTNTTLPVKNVMILDSYRQLGSDTALLNVEDLEKYPAPFLEAGGTYNKVKSMYANAKAIGLSSKPLKPFLLTDEAVKTIKQDINGISARMLEPVNPFKTGKLIGSFAIESMDGTLINTKALVNRVTVLNFWFTTCGPCIVEMPMLNELVTDNKTKDVGFFGITYEKKKDVQLFLEKRSFLYKQVSDQEKLITQLGVRSYPVTVILDKKGIIRYSSAYRLPVKEQLQQLIDQLLVNE